MTDDDLVRSLQATAQTLPVMAVSPGEVREKVRRRRTARASGVIVGAMAMSGLGLYAAGPLAEALSGQSVVASERTPCDDPEGCATPSHSALLAELDGIASGNADYGHAEVSPDGTRVLLYWHGPLPEPIQELADRSASEGVPLIHVNIPYTREEVQSAIVRVVDSYSAQGVTYRSVGGASDYSSLVVSVPADDPDLQRAAVEAAASVTAIPITIVPDQGPGQTEFFVP